MKKLYIVNSCYNPTDDWADQYMNQAHAYRSKLKHKYDVYFTLVNDGSSTKLDDDIERIKQNVPAFNYFSYPKNEGKGFALRYGVRKCEGDLYCYTDVDFPYTAESLLSMLKGLETQNADLTMGVRDSIYFRSIPIQRRIISKTLIWINKRLLRLEYPDTQCGIKLINQKGKDQFLKVKTNGFLFEVDFILQSRKILKVTTTPVELRSSAILSNISMSTLVRLLKEYIGIQNRKSN